MTTDNNPETPEDIAAIDEAFRKASSRVVKPAHERFQEVAAEVLGIAQAMDARALVAVVRDELVAALDRDDPKAAITEILGAIDAARTAEHDPRTAHVTELHAVWDHDGSRGAMNVRAVFPSKSDAHRFVAGQWAGEYYDVEPVPVVWSLPERRPLYIMNGTLPYPAGPPTFTEDEIAADGEFPGLGNGAIVPFDEVKTELSEVSDGGWHMRAVGWDQDETEHEYIGVLDAAKRMRDALTAAFARFGQGDIVTVDGDDGDEHQGKVLARITHRGVPGWRDVTGNGLLIHDRALDPDKLRIIQTGGGS